MGVSLIDFGRVLAAFVLIFLAIPFTVRRRPGVLATEGLLGLATAFVHVSFFMQAAILILARLRLGLPGLVCFAYFVWAAGNLVWKHRKRIGDQSVWGKCFLSFLVMIDAGAWRTAWKRLRSAISGKAPSAALALFSLLLTTIVLQRAWFSLHNTRFTHIETYARALSLNALTSGHVWAPEGSAPLFAPLVYLSGLDPATVVRFGGPIFATMLVLAVGFWAFQPFRCNWSGYLACGLAAVLPVIAQTGDTYEITRGDLSCIYLLLALGLFGESVIASALAGITGVLIDTEPHATLFAATACVIAVVFVVWAGKHLPVIFRVATVGATATVVTFVLCSDLQRTIPPGPFQYEAAARVSNNIANGFPRNSWLVISPVHEVASTYGRGWHVELMDFVAKYSLREVSDPYFRFPYPVSDVFVFIEKQPLRPPPEDGRPLARSMVSVAQSLEPAVLAYGDSIRRATIEFQAAALLSGYARSHQGVRTYYEDEFLTVYWLRNSPSPALADSHGRLLAATKMRLSPAGARLAFGYRQGTR